MGGDAETLPGACLAEIGSVALPAGEVTCGSGRGRNLWDWLGEHCCFEGVACSDAERADLVLRVDGFGEGVRSEGAPDAVRMAMGRACGAGWVYVVFHLAGDGLSALVSGLPLGNRLAWDATGGKLAPAVVSR